MNNQLTPEAFKERIVQKYPNGVSNDGRRYADMDARELTQKIVQKYPEGTTDDGHRYSDFIMDRADSAPQPQVPEGKSIGGFIDNFGTSAWNLGKGIVHAVAHPIQTGEALGGLGLGLIEKVIPGEQRHEKYANALGKYYGDRYGGLSNIGNTLYEDPVGVLTDLATVATGAGGIATKVGTIAKLEKLAKVGETVSAVGKAIDPINAVAGAANKAIDVTKGLVSPTLARQAQKLETASLRMTPTAERKLILKEGKFDTTPDVSDSELIKYGTERKLVGSPEERYGKQAENVENLEKQVDFATENSRQTVSRQEIIDKLRQTADEFKKSPGMYADVKKVIDDKIAALENYDIFPGTPNNVDHLSMAELQTLKRDAWNEGKFSMASSNNSRKAERMAGHVFKSAIEDAFERGGEKIFGKSPADFNREYGMAIGYKKLLENAIGKNEVGLVGRALGAVAGNRAANALGSGELGKIAGSAAGERIANTVAGTKARSALGAGLKRMSETKAPGKFRGLMTTRLKRAARSGYYADRIRENLIR